MNLVLEINEAWIEGVDLNADTFSESSRRNFLKKFTPLEQKNGEKLSMYAAMKINQPDG